MSKENLNIHVFTTKFVLKEKSPILKVFHDDEGDWQFIGKEIDLKEEDAMVVSLKEILEYDPSLRKVLSLPVGNMAHRANSTSDWIFNK
jgi:hypothetical protein